MFKKSSEKEPANRKFILAVAVTCVAVLLLIVVTVFALKGCSRGTEKGSDHSQYDDALLNGKTTPDPETERPGTGSDQGNSEGSTSEPSGEPEKTPDVSGTPSVSESPGEPETNKPSATDDPVTEKPHETSAPVTEKPAETTKTPVSTTAKPEETKKPDPEPEPPKTYHTSWGTRPHEFEEGPFVMFNGDFNVNYGDIGLASGVFLEHADGYNNTWYTYNGQIVGNRSVFYGGAFSGIGPANYFGYGVWSHNGYYWDEDGVVNGYTQIPAEGFQYPKLLNQPTPWEQDMDRVDNGEIAPGNTFVYFFINIEVCKFAVEFNDSFYAFTDVLLSFSSFDELFNFLDDLPDDHLVKGFRDREMYERLNMHTYDDLKRCILDPVNYDYSNSKLPS